MNNYKFMTDDLTNRICEFGSKHFGVTIDVDYDQVTVWNNCL